MTDKKRGRPSVKKTDEEPFVSISLPTPRACWAFRNENKDKVAMYRARMSDAEIIKQYEVLHDPKILGKVWMGYYKTISKPHDLSDLLSVSAFLDLLPMFLCDFSEKILLMGAAYLDIVIGGQA